MRTQHAIRDSGFGIRGLIVCSLATIAGTGCLAAAQPHDPGNPGDPRDPGPNAARHAPRRILVRLRTAADNDATSFVAGDESENWRAAPEPDSVRDIVEDLVAQATGGRVLHRFWFVPGLQVWEVAEGQEALGCEQATDLPWIKYATRPRVGELAGTYPNDPAYQAGYQYGLDRICMPKAWDIIKDSSAYPIAIIDSGVDYTHSQLSQSVLVNSGEPLPLDGVDNDANGYTDDRYGANVAMFNVSCSVATSCQQTCEGDPVSMTNPHGTHVASVAAARTDDCRSTAGVGYNARIIPIKVMSEVEPSCGYYGVFTTTEILLAFEYAVSRGAKILNCSWTASDIDDEALYECYKALDEANVVAVMAAGNYLVDIDSSSPPPGYGIYPARYTFSNMIVVGASNQSDDAWFHSSSPAIGSNYGSVSVDLFAPGVAIRLPYLDSTTSCSASTSGPFTAGTSFAAPHVAGVAALVWAHNPTFSATDVVNQLVTSARPVSALSGLCVSGGVLDASAALGGSACNP